MESCNIEQLISTLIIFPSNDILQEISKFFFEAQNHDLNIVISQYFESLLSLENWAWKILSRDCRTWDDEEQQYIYLFQNLSFFNRKLISSNYTISTKESLLLPKEIYIIDGLFEQNRTRTNENDRLLLFIYLWLDNISLLIHAHPELISSNVMSSMMEQIMSNIIKSDQFKIYLNQLEHPNPIFTSKEIFYIKTSTFLLGEFLSSNPHTFSCSGQETIEYLAQDCITIVVKHRETISSWSTELLSSITHLIGLMSACLWWNGIDHKILDIIPIHATHDISIFRYSEALIDILFHTPFHDQIFHESTNDESILIENILWSLDYFSNFQNIKEHFRSSKKLFDALMKLDHSNNGRLNLRLYKLQSEIFSEKQMQESNVTKNIYETFFNYIQQASKNSSQKYKNISMDDLLTGLLKLSKIDEMNYRFADTDELKFLIKLTDTYPAVYDILWSLSFNADIKNQLRQNQVFMNKLASRSTNEEIQNMIDGIQWNLNSSQMQSNNGDCEKAFQVTISYSDQDESFFKWLHSTLTQKRYLVCNSSHRIDQNLINAMVKDVDQSSTIIICMSKTYKQSNFCRAEATYAFDKKLKIIPILIENDYKPEGWLSSLVHGLIPIDFIKSEVSTAIQTLLDELKDSHRYAIGAIAILHQPRHVGNLLHSRSADVSEWTQNEVKQWLTENNLSEMVDILSGFTGRDLIRLSALISQHSPQANLDLLQEESLKKTGKNVCLTEVVRLRGLIEQHIQESVQPTKWTLKLCCRFYLSSLFK